MMVDEALPSALATTDRRLKDRRTADRRKNAEETYTGEERRTGPRRKVERRRMIDPTTCERDYSDDEIEFMKAMDDYKRKSGRAFPTWSEVLEVVRALGYNRPQAVPALQPQD
ncbi:MAG TPA: hypothetical protein VL132_18280 [Planctomycetaceae bacterium]|jgi:hypothetical protein|nr:hypothetical protein SH412_003490 [Planctomycetaceae bacterium SH412]HTN03841.1 hypothetical protein [Planctomycetaceae bacterium]